LVYFLKGVKYERKDKPKILYKGRISRKKRNKKIILLPNYYKKQKKLQITKNLKYYLRIGFQRICNAAIFSIANFATIGYGYYYAEEYKPEIKIYKIRIPFFKVRTIVLIEGILGWFLMPVFIITITKVFLR